MNEDSVFSPEDTSQEVERLARPSKKMLWAPSERYRFEITMPPTVYPPREDTDLLAKRLIHLGPGRGRKFLEIGCGSGADLEVFLKIDSIKKITAIDLGENINSLKSKFKNFTNIQIEKGNALDLPFSDNIFDTIYSFGIFHHTADP